MDKIEILHYQLSISDVRIKYSKRKLVDNIKELDAERERLCKKYKCDVNLTYKKK